MSGWAVQGVLLPFGDEPSSRWVDGHGRVHDRPVAGAETLPGRFFLTGLVDSHAHPAVAPGATGPVALGYAAAQANLVSWAETGVALVRDLGSPGGLVLDLTPAVRQPVVRAAGRFLAPPGGYFPELLVEPVADEQLIDAALAEIARGATWVKVIADFPRPPKTPEAVVTYAPALVERLCAAAHAAGARVAAHTTLPDVADLVAAGVDSVEHGPGLDEETIAEMARRGVAWTPTLGALLALASSEDAPPERRRMALEARERLPGLLALAVRLGVPVLAGTDVTGTLPQEVALLARMGLEPAQALAAASDWPRRFLDVPVERADIITYEHDPREDPEMLTRPAAVVVQGVRLR